MIPQIRHAESVHDSCKEETTLITVMVIFFCFFLERKKSKNKEAWGRGETLVWTYGV